MDAEAAPVPLGAMEASAEPAAAAVVAGPKTFFVIAHGNYTVNDRNYIETCFLNGGPLLESVVTVTGFPGAAILKTTVQSVGSFMNTIRDQPASNLQRAFPSVVVSELGVPSPLHRNNITGRVDNGNSLAGLYKGKDVFIQITNPVVTNVTNRRKSDRWGTYLQQLLRMGLFFPSVIFSYETPVLRRVISAFTISAYVPRPIASPPATRILKLNLSGPTVGDEVGPWIGIWDAETFAIGPDGNPLADRKIITAEPNPIFGPIDNVLDRVVALDLGRGRPVRIVFFCCGVLAGPTREETEAICMNSLRALYQPYVPPPGAGAGAAAVAEENTVRLYTFMPATLQRLLYSITTQRVFGAAGGAGAGVGAGGRRQTVRKHKKRRSTVRKASRFGRKGRLRRQ